MFHSVPAALIAGGVAFLLTSGDDLHLRCYKAGGVVLGYVAHLMLDELYSIEWYRGRLRLKKSFGTAMKVIGRGWLPNLVTYASLAMLTTLVLNEPRWMEDFRHQRDGAESQQYAAESNEPGAATGASAKQTSDDSPVVGPVEEAVHREAKRVMSWFE